MGQVSPKSLAKGEDNWRRRWAIKGEEKQQGRGFRKIERRKRERKREKSLLVFIPLNPCTPLANILPIYIKL